MADLREVLVIRTANANLNQCLTIDQHYVMDHAHNYKPALARMLCNQRSSIIIIHCIWYIS